MTDDPTEIHVRGYNGKVIATFPILRCVTLRGVKGFCIHRYTDEKYDDYRVSHIETGAVLTYGDTDGEAFVRARRVNKEELEHKIIRTRREIDRLLSLSKGDK